MIETIGKEIGIKNFFVLPSQGSDDPTLIKDPDEGSKLPRLLESIYIDKSQVAACTDSQTGIKTSLLAINAEAQTKQPLPLTQSSFKQLQQIVLPSTDSYKTGLFVTTSEEGLHAVVRNYKSGLPLMASLMFNRRWEVPFKIGGFKDDIGIEMFWARRIKLFKDLNFTENQSRGIFKCGLHNGSWNDSPLYVSSKPGIYKPGTTYEQPLINGFQVLVYKDWEETNSNPYLKKLVGAFNLQIATNKSEESPN